MGNVTIAVAVGLFGILSIFTLLQTSDKSDVSLVWVTFPSSGCACAGRPRVFGVLTAAYWGVSRLGFTCFVLRREFKYWPIITDTNDTPITTRESLRKHS